MAKRRNKQGCFPSAFFLILILLAVVIGVLFIVPQIASRIYGPPASALSNWQIYRYSAMMLWYDGLLTSPADLEGSEKSFRVQDRESVISISNRLYQSRLILDANAFRDYLVYSGLDKSIQSGEYSLTSAMSAVQIAQELQDATPEQVMFVILPGWRLEEIAASLPTSGLNITAESFLKAARTPPDGLDFLGNARTTEGFLFPGQYSFPREITADQLVTSLVRQFALSLTPEMREGFGRQGLTVFEAVILASIVQREAVVADEQPLIASVFINRYNVGMKLDTDPTVQYALGYNEVQKTWWTNPLSRNDLRVDSPYNTYLYAGLPPGPISNPGLGALRAVAFPAESPYYYFRARCDGTGLHLFAENFEQHLQNACP